ncbi:hypothetical protein LTR17_016934 [Elasticomyces elasticus]|nr:hypothetical protein LTR17_016934 [Elasticomyces elasticus]
MAAKRANYAAFAEFLSSYPDELALRRFRELSIRNLLAYQAELLHLERELQDLEDLDASHHPQLDTRVNRRWTPAMARATTTLQTPCTVAGTQPAQPTLNSPQPGQVTISDEYSGKMLEIRQTLWRYNEALDQYLKQEALPSPSKSSLQACRKWLDLSELGASFLTDSEEDAWGPSIGNEEFMAFAPRQNITTFFATGLLGMWRLLHCWSSSPTRIYSINSSDEGRIARGISVVVSSVFPILPIIVFYFVHSLLVRIGLILAFTAIFAGLLVFGMRLSPDKVLAITTA